MFKKPSKKQFIIRRIVLGTIATVSVIVIVAVTVLFLLGYRLDSGNGRLEQGALLQFESQPNGADVTVDDQPIGAKTASKATTLAGQRTVKMSKEGYETWTRTLTLEAGTLTWLDYARLVPKVRTVQTVAQYPTLASMTFSPDLKWGLALEKVDVPQFQLIDIRAEDIKTSTLALGSSLYSESTNAAATHRFVPVVWNTNGRYVLVKHLYKNATTDTLEWLLVDTQDVAKSVNVTRLLSVSLKDVQFAGTGGTTLFGLSDDGIVRRLDVSAATLSRGLLSKVDSFSVVASNIIVYSGIDGADATQHVLGVYRDGEERPWVLHKEQTNQSLHIVAGRYYNDDYVAFAVGPQLTILSGSFPTSGSESADSLKEYASLSLKSAVSSLIMSPVGGYLVAQSGNSFVSYELEQKRIGNAELAPNGQSVASSLRWLDEAHLWSDDNGAVTMRDFNGINAHSIMEVAPGFGATLSQNGRFIYGVGIENGIYRLQRVKMILD